MRTKYRKVIFLALFCVLSFRAYSDLDGPRSNYIVAFDSENNCEYGFVTTYVEDNPFEFYPKNEYVLLSKYSDLEHHGFYFGQFFYFDTFLQYIKNYEHVYTQQTEGLFHYENILKEFISEDGDISGDDLIRKALEIFLDYISEEIEKLSTMLARGDEDERSLQMKEDLVEIYISKQLEAEEMKRRYREKVNSFCN